MSLQSHPAPYEAVKTWVHGEVTRFAQGSRRAINKVLNVNHSRSSLWVDTGHDLFSSYFEDML